MDPGSFCDVGVTIEGMDDNSRSDKAHDDYYYLVYGRIRSCYSGNSELPFRLEHTSKTDSMLIIKTVQTKEGMMPVMDDLWVCL